MILCSKTTTTEQECEQPPWVPQIIMSALLFVFQKRRSVCVNVT